MIVSFGKHKGMAVETLVLKEADYIRWVLLHPDPSGELASLRTEVSRLIAIFDQKPFVGKCSGAGCARAPVRVSAYAGSADSIYQWCGSCDPYSEGAADGKLTFIQTYAQALRHVTSTDRGVQSSYRTIVKNLAIAKGLPKRSGEVQVREFFGS